MKPHVWHNVAFTIEIDLSVHRGQLIDCSGIPVDCIPVPAGLAEDDAVTIILECESSGIDDPGHRGNGDRDLGDPPYFEDNRKVVAAQIVAEDRSPAFADRDTVEQLAARFFQRAEAEDLSEAGRE